MFKFALQWSKCLFICEWYRNFKDWSTDNMKKKTGFNGYVYDFSVDYDATDVDDIKDIHKYLMKKIT